MKTLIVVRHGWAGQSGDVVDDDLRTLDQRGRRETRLVAKGLRFLLKKCTLVLASPLTRSQQTADILIQFGLSKKIKPTWVVMRELRPESDPKKTWAELKKNQSHDVVMIVGHEPHLSSFLSLLLTGDTLNPLPLKKGAVAVFDVAHPDERVLKCLIQPSHLIKIRKSRKSRLRN